jgi:hypothetical protein
MVHDKGRLHKMFFNEFFKEQVDSMASLMRWGLKDFAAAQVIGADTT